MTDVSCRGCGATFRRLAGRGRPREYCDGCVKLSPNGERKGGGSNRWGYHVRSCGSCGLEFKSAAREAPTICPSCRPVVVQLCEGCGAKAPTGSFARYCAECRGQLRAEQGRRQRVSNGRRRERERDRPNSAARGYGHRHRERRKKWKARVEAGGVCCWRCGNQIIPGSEWDLGHDDIDRRVYRGPEHPKCNRATSGRDPYRQATRVRRRKSRDW